MRIVFFIVLLLHGAIHLMGFIQAYGIAKLNNLPQTLSRPVGILWLTGCILLLLTAVLFQMKQASWYWIAFIAILLSQFLIIQSWQDAKFGTILNVLILGVALLAFAAAHFKDRYLNDIKRQPGQVNHIPAELLTEQDIAHLPVLVQRYIRYSGSLGKPKINSFRITFSGRIRKNNENPWMPFTSEQYNVIERPARFFFMNAVMNKLPVTGYHRYVMGKASMDIRLLSFYKVQAMKGHDMDVAETVTFFNDMCCLAPATLIDPRIQWLETDGDKVHAAFRVGDITIRAILYFGNHGELVNFRSDDRLNADTGTRLPWYTPLSDYRDINGFHLASYAEAFYTYAIGPICYGNFKLESIEYNPVIP